MLSKAIEFAKNNGFNGAKYHCEWNGFKCYEPLFDRSKESRKVGMLEILVDRSGNARMATSEEFFEILDNLPDE
ncbi:MAG: hypothetical protein IJ071_00315 [Ruminococcus sp.]|nr:hypothetical protein [Ruminococcus sp.]